MIIDDIELFCTNILSAAAVHNCNFKYCVIL